MHHGTVIRRCRPDPIPLLAPLAEWLEHYDACMCMGSNPGQSGKKFVKNDFTNQVKFELSTLRHYLSLSLSLYIYIYIYIYIHKDSRS